MLLHDEPRDVLVIGLASGITVGSVGAHPVQSIRVVEIEKAMVPAARLFDEFNNHVLDDPRVAVSINDARNELEFSSADYDVIISEPSNPWMTVASNLFTEDFFRMARTRVRPGGIFAQWIQTYYLPPEDLRSIIAAFHAAFPNVMLFETMEGVDLLLLGSEHGPVLDRDVIGARMSELDVRLDLARVEMRRPLDILGLFRLGPAEVAALVEGAPRNTDDNARVEFSAPRTLGLPTVDENLAMIRKHRADLLSYIEPGIGEDEERDRIRLYLAEAWLMRGDFTLAVETARQIPEGPLRARADEIVQAAQNLQTNL